MESLMVIILSLLTVPRSTAFLEESDNYIAHSSTFASIAAIEDIILPEAVIMRRLEGYHGQMKQSMKLLERYIQNWKDMNMAAALQRRENIINNYVEKESQSKNLIEGKTDEGTDINNSSLINGTASDVKEVNTTQLSSSTKTDVRKEEIFDSVAEIMKRPHKIPEGAGVYHPVDGYLLLKRLSLGWKKVKDSLTQLQDDGGTLLEYVAEEREKYFFPVSADLNGAAVALVRLQDLYDMDMETLGSGIIRKKYTHVNKDLKSMGALRPWDYIFLGKHAYKLGFSSRAINWFKLAVKTSKNMQLNEEERMIVPQLRKQIIENEPRSKKFRKQDNTKDNYKPLLRNSISYLDDLETKNRLCKGNKYLSAEEESKLVCRYETMSSPYLILQPLLMEEVNHNPHIAVFHKFLTDNQSEIIISNARPRLETSTHKIRNSFGESMTRISMTGWINEFGFKSKHPIVKISKKIESATNMVILAPNASEQYQVANYGLGGHYDVHPDYGVQVEEIMGDRLATFLIYLSDVNAGGSTAFPRLGIRVNPEKGMALLWHNLLKSGEPDHLTQHAACPILHGSKWITTKWIHVNSQFLKKPCGLNKDERFRIK